ncbi:QueT transporter family protein [uncultured Oscillibacter sp.]|uniref:QueT transporter family protein n=1 Tax=uncultured Oscillibacter sp. TaxID=876091 RepID=UPI0025DCC9DE|nr:QueT transporter family protein [uncultured Oscillibacter sp.]
MSKSRFTVQQIAFAGIVGALYAVLSYFAAIFGVAYGPVQFRFSEALCVLPFLFPAAAPGLFVGCLVANLLSPYGALDIIFGSLATLLAAILTMKAPNKWLAPLPPVLCNAAIVGAVISFQQTGFTDAFPAALAYNALTLGLGEAAVCYVLGGILLAALSRVRGLRPMMAEDRVLL